jgi:hypothetical protein
MTVEISGVWSTWILVVEVITSVGVLVILYWIRELYLAARAMQLNLLKLRGSASRPWINVEILADGDLEKRQDGSGISINVLYQNVGMSPAIRAHTVVASAPLGHEAEVLAKISKQTRETGVQLGILLGPGESFSRPWYWSFKVEDWPNEIDRMVARLVVGCVTYESPLDDELHQTAFAFVVEETEVGVEFKPWAGSYAT